jgi:hypothetical protein
MNPWHAARSQSNVLRKAAAYANQVPRAMVRRRARDADYAARPALIANSFPKSGTHLLIQILQGLPNAIYFGSFIASMPTIPFRERSCEAHLRLIGRTVPGEVVGAHIFYDPEHAAALARLNCAHFFVYRDPRDVAVAEAHYLTRMNRWHRMHRYFARHLETDGERISAAILGVSDPDFPYDYPDIARRFARYRGWLDRTDVFAMRFEDLISESRRETLGRITSFYGSRGGVEIDADAVLDEIEANIDPRKSHTFREGRSGGWRRSFTPRHKEQMKRVAGQLLVDLGYEQDHAW